MKNVLDVLELLARYGLIDIVFGIGVTGLLWRFLIRIIPSRYEWLEVNATAGGQVKIPGAGAVNQSFQIQLVNSGSTNCYVGRAYFRPKLRRWWLLWLKRTPTRIQVHPQSHRIVKKDAFELKFQDQEHKDIFSEFETLLRPGNVTGQTTWLALSTPVQQDDIDKHHCGVLYVEYAARGKQGVHAERI
jgi:hypothetical protein